MAIELLLSEEHKVRKAMSGLKDANPGVREKAVFDLVRGVGDVDEAIVAVASALHDKDINVCRQAAASLFMFGVKARIVLPSLIAALNHNDLIIRRAAAATLSLIGPEARAALAGLRQLEHDSDEMLRVWVRAALQAIGEPETTS